MRTTQLPPYPLSPPFTDLPPLSPNFLGHPHQNSHPNSPSPQPIATPTHSSSPHPPPYPAGLLSHIATPAATSHLSSASPFPFPLTSLPNLPQPHQRRPNPPSPPRSQSPPHHLSATTGSPLDPSLVREWKSSRWLRRIKIYKCLIRRIILWTLRRLVLFISLQISLEMACITASCSLTITLKRASLISALPPIKSSAPKFVCLNNSATTPRQGSLKLSLPKFKPILPAVNGFDALWSRVPSFRFGDFTGLWNRVRSKGLQILAMRHGRRVPKLNRPPDQRRALLRGLTTQLLKHGRIKTTVARAKAMRSCVEKMITLAKNGSLHKRRQALGFIYDKRIVHAMFAEVPERYGDRNGGYTRVVKTFSRRGDNAPMAFIELV